MREKLTVGWRERREEGVFTKERRGTEDEKVSRRGMNRREGRTM